MANFLDISEDGHTSFLNLDLVLVLGLHVTETHEGMKETSRVVVSTQPGGNGIVLPARFTIEEIAQRMKTGQHLVLNQFNQSNGKDDQ